MLAPSKKTQRFPIGKKTASIQAALDELARLNSYTETGLNYTEYSDRLLTTKGNIDVALSRTSDQRAKEKIDRAVRCYVEARNEWKRKNDDKYSSGLGVQYYWNEGITATNLAAEFAAGDEIVRERIDVLEREKEKQKMADAKEAQDRKDQAEKERLARAIEAEKQKIQAEQKLAAENAERERTRRAEESERERKRRFAPEGIVFNVKPITITNQDGLVTIPPGTELTVTKKNPDDTLHVEKEIWPQPSCRPT